MHVLGLANMDVIWRSWCQIGLLDDTWDFSATRRRIVSVQFGERNSTIYDQRVGTWSAPFNVYEYSASLDALGLDERSVPPSTGLRLRKAHKTQSA